MKIIMTITFEVIIIIMTIYDYYIHSVSRSEEALRSPLINNLVTHSRSVFNGL